MKLTRQQVERAADTIKFKIRLDGCSEWTEKGLRETKWPQDFSPDERKYIRNIVKIVWDAIVEPRALKTNAIREMVAEAQKLNMP